MLKIGFWKNYHQHKKSVSLQQEQQHLSFDEIAEKLAIPADVLSFRTEPVLSSESAKVCVQPPLCPGEVILLALEAKCYTQAELARCLSVSRQQVSYLVHGQRPITLEYALRIGAVLDIPPYVLLRLQADYDLYQYYIGKSSIR